MIKGPPWRYGSWIYNYHCNQCLSPLMLWVRILIRARCTILCDKVCQWLAACWWFSLRLPVSSTTKTDCYDIAEILLKVVLNTIKPNQSVDQIMDSHTLLYTNNSWIVLPMSFVLCCLFKIPWKLKWFLPLQLTFYRYVENTFRTASFHWDGSFGRFNKFNSATFHWRTLYLC